MKDKNNIGNHSELYQSNYSNRSLSFIKDSQVDNIFDWDNFTSGSLEKEEKSTLNVNSNIPDSQLNTNFINNDFDNYLSWSEGNSLENPGFVRKIKCRREENPECDRKETNLNMNLLKKISFPEIFIGILKRSSELIIKTEVKRLIKKIVKKLIIKQMKKRDKKLGNDHVTLERKLNRQFLIDENKCESFFQSKETASKEKGLDDIWVVISPFGEKNETNFSVGHHIQGDDHNCKCTLPNLNKTPSENFIPFSFINNCFVHSLETDIVQIQPLNNHRAIATSPILITEKGEGKRMFSSLLKCASGDDKRGETVIKRNNKYTSRFFFRRLFNKNKSKDKNIYNKDAQVFLRTNYSRLKNSNSIKDKSHQNEKHSKILSLTKLLKSKNKSSKKNLLEIDHSNENFITNSLLTPYFQALSCEKNTKVFGNLDVRGRLFYTSPTSQINNLRKGQCKELTRHFGSVFIID